MAPNIRSATLDDIAAILAIEQEAATAAHWPAEEYEKLVQTGVVLVGEQAGRVCGFVCAKAVAGEWEIENVVVSGGSLRQGIGDRLVGTLVQEAGKLAASRILLEVRESNRPARRLYEKHGFRQVGRRTKYYNNPAEDALVYELRGASEEHTGL